MVIGDFWHWIDLNEGNGDIEIEITNGTYNCIPLGQLIGTLLSVNSGIGATYTVSYTPGTGFRFDTDAQQPFSLLWQSGTHGSDGKDTHIGTILGFNDVADDTGALYYIADWPVNCLPHGDNYQRQMFMFMD